MSIATRSRALTSAIAASFLVLTLAACGGAQNPGNAEVSANTTASGTHGESYPRTIKHDKGSTTIAVKPKRVVALDNSLAEAVVTLKSPLVGGIGNYRDQKGWPPYLGEAVKDTVDVGPLDNPNLEKIAALKPDLIVSATVRHDALYDRLSSIAPTVFVKTTGPIWKQNITFLGQVLGEEKAAKTQLDAYEKRAQSLGSAIKEKGKDPSISVVRFVDGPVRLYLPDSFSGIILSDMGLKRPAAQQEKGELTKEISEEQIGLADAGHIFVSSFSGGKEQKAKFEANPLWGRLEAVKEGNVHEVSDQNWMTSVSLQGADLVMDDLAKIFEVDPQKA
ncbi:ABC transporter substrate-binding protein [Dermatophilus congolensis]|uniref:ABC transporter substrate-binding protein n=1 Tax=Dermatophilus congolensis TaxID=1863 RepID=UPI001AAFE3EC|nr:iron-siderophore ABC transporter substrate-binding protein [Dermatophilus congolensis]MBO3128590.1 iron-siderophore ABC transporter substrate-binding protein [Dermatophilus congolensis]MBO3132773.1 iron-siderophore ABC transporter substrate-binding protein [Dermatophilus congolensis]MBO3133068.1 iron-siderophore ABC transporter substrate-binding protein [Dermatophilus congolensis]MBO3135300.1 iron-siderophore ABC transporter substrate-binding protein [Dermatophilus congolensis]MBO3137543.1 